MTTCLICHRPLGEDYDPMPCCSGRDCGCMGMPTNPPVCSEACHGALFDGVGRGYEERRINAGIELYSAIKKCPHCNSPQGAHFDLCFSCGTSVEFADAGRSVECLLREIKALKDQALLDKQWHEAGYKEWKCMRSALETIARYDEEPIWTDDRDDSARDMLEIARKALVGEEAEI